MVEAPYRPKVGEDLYAGPAAVFRWLPRAGALVFDCNGSPPQHEALPGCVKDHP